MRRALLTAHCIFSVHPNFEKIDFILAPLARETLIFAGDIPSNINSVISDFGPLFPKGLNLRHLQDLDIRRDLWFLQPISARKEIFDSLTLKQTDALNSHAMNLLDIISYRRTHNLDGIESAQDAVERCK